MRHSELARDVVAVFGKDQVEQEMGIFENPFGRNSVAVLRDVTSKTQYRVKVGQEIGRMRVARIGEQSVAFNIEEFGYSRQETLAMNDSTKVSTQ